MKILNVGTLELLLVFLIMLIILGPDDMVNIARKLGRAVYRFIKSPIFKSIKETSREIRELPRRFISEAGADEVLAEFKKETGQVADRINDPRLLDSIPEVGAEVNEILEDTKGKSKIPDVTTDLVPAKIGDNNNPELPKAPSKRKPPLERTESLTNSDEEFV